MTVIHDNEFGEITVRRSGKSRSMRASVAPNGTLRLSLPTYAPLFLAKRMIAGQRTELRRLIHQQPKMTFHDGMSIGKSHSLHVRSGEAMSIHRSGQQLIVTSPNQDISSSRAQNLIRDHVIQSLRREAKAHLPRRLAFLADAHGYEYGSVRFSHASSRWGSCSSKGTISLNIALMNLPFELIDYVLIHELAHTKQMNHSAKFWDLVESGDPRYKQHRKILKTHSPSL